MDDQPPNTNLFILSYLEPLSSPRKLQLFAWFLKASRCTWMLSFEPCAIANPKPPQKQKTKSSRLLSDLPVHNCFYWLFIFFFFNQLNKWTFYLFKKSKKQTNKQLGGEMMLGCSVCSHLGLVPVWMCDLLFSLCK